MRMRCLFFPLCSAIALTSFVQAQSLERHPLYEPALVSAGTPGDAGNLFAGAKVTASGHYGSDRPELAVDGQTNNAGKYWGCEGIPVWLQIDMGKPRTLSSLHVWPYWEGGRIYKYKIEGSLRKAFPSNSIRRRSVTLKSLFWAIVPAMRRGGIWWKSKGTDPMPL